MALSAFLRVCAAALALSTLSFAAGVAGDLSEPPPVHGVSVVVPIPPLLAADAPRAAPLTPMRTAAAEALPPLTPAPTYSPVALPAAADMVSEHELAHSAPDVALALKAEPRKFG